MLIYIDVSGKSFGIPWNSGTWEEQRNNVTTKQHQEILPLWNEEILNRCNKSAQENEK